MVTKMKMDGKARKARGTFPDSRTGASQTETRKKHGVAVELLKKGRGAEGINVRKSVLFFLTNLSNYYLS